MLARVAENVFWLSRYLERMESSARLIHVHGNLVMDMADGDVGMGWLPLVSIAGLDEEFHRHFDEPNEENVSYFLLADERNAGSLINAIGAVRDNLRSSRDTLPRRLYEAITDLYLMVRSRTTAGIEPAHRQAFLKAVEQKLLAIAGIMEGSLRHDLGYLIMRMGCYLERADMTSRILDVRSASLGPRPPSTELQPFENRGWVSVLDSVNAVQMYRQHVRKPVNGPDVLAFLLRDPGLPRAYRFCLDHLGQCLRQLGKNEGALEALAAVESRIDGADIRALATDSVALHGYIDDLQIGLGQVADQIAISYFPPRSDAA